MMSINHLVGIGNNWVFRPNYSESDKSLEEINSSTEEFIPEKLELRSNFEEIII